MAARVMECALPFFRNIFFIVFRLRHHHSMNHRRGCHLMSRRCFGHRRRRYFARRRRHHCFGHHRRRKKHGRMNTLRRHIRVRRHTNGIHRRSDRMNHSRANRRYRFCEQPLSDLRQSCSMHAT